MNNDPSTALVGTWRLLSIQIEMADTKERVDLYGPHPMGRIIFTSSGRLISIATAGDRGEPTDQASTAKLFGSMMAYSGTYRVAEDDQAIFKLDLSWHPGWVGTEQVRFFKIEGDRLSIRTGLQTHPAHPGKQVYGVIEWEREP